MHTDGEAGLDASKDLYLLTDDVVAVVTARSDEAVAGSSDDERLRPLIDRMKEIAPGFAEAWTKTRVLVLDGATAEAIRAGAGVRTAQGELLALTRAQNGRFLTVGRVHPMLATAPGLLLMAMSLAPLLSGPSREEKLLREALEKIDKILEQMERQRQAEIRAASGRIQRVFDIAVSMGEITPGTYELVSGVGDALEVQRETARLELVAAFQDMSRKPNKAKQTKQIVRRRWVDINSATPRLLAADAALYRFEVLHAWFLLSTEDPSLPHFIDCYKSAQQSRRAEREKLRSDLDKALTKLYKKPGSSGGHFGFGGTSKSKVRKSIKRLRKEVRAIPVEPNSTEYFHSLPSAASLEVRPEVTMRTTVVQDTSTLVDQA